MSVIRLLDAAADRAVEGLRVVEDYTRFVLNDRFLTESLKRFRHQLTTQLSVVPMEQRLCHRETQYDVGASIALPSEFRRENQAAVLQANFSRLQEALRSLEETAKYAFPAAAPGLEQLRYQSYTLQKAVQALAKKSSVPRLQEFDVIFWQNPSDSANLAAYLSAVQTNQAAVQTNQTANSLNASASPALENRSEDSQNELLPENVSRSEEYWFLLTDDKTEKTDNNEDKIGKSGGGSDAMSESAAGDGARLSDREKYARGLGWKNRVEEIGGKILTDRRIDLARAIQAHGVLLDQDSLSVFAARDVLEPGALVGVRVQTEQQAQQAILDAADFIVLPGETPAPDWLVGYSIPLFRKRNPCP